MAKILTATHSIRLTGKWGMPAVWELERRLREHGFEPRRASDLQMLFFEAPVDVDLDFLRPDFLPPR